MLARLRRSIGVHPKPHNEGRPSSSISTGTDSSTAHTTLAEGPSRPEIAPLQPVTNMSDIHHPPPGPYMYIQYLQIGDNLSRISGSYNHGSNNTDSFNIIKDPIPNDQPPAQEKAAAPYSKRSYDMGANGTPPPLDNIATNLPYFSFDNLSQSPKALSPPVVTSVSTSPPPFSLQGTALCSLLDYLIHSDDPEVANARHGVICIASCVAFATSSTVIQYLIGRYMSNDEERSNILKLLKFWVCHQVITVDESCLSSVRDFALNQAANGSSEDNRKLAEQIYRAIYEREGLCTQARPSTKRCAPKTPEELASTLTAFEGAKFKRALWDHCIKYVCGQGGHPSIQDVLETIEKLKNWVMYCVLSKEEPRIRAREFKFFVSTAQECQKLGNFSSMFSIVAALSKIATLPTTFSMFSNIEGNLKLWNELRNIRERSFYMEQLQSKRSSCVPLLMLHLNICKDSLQKDDLAAFIMSRNAVGLVDLAKWDHIAARIGELAYDIPIIEGDHDAMLSYIQDQLDTCNTVVTQAMMQQVNSKEKHDQPMQLQIRGYRNALFS